MIDKKQVEPGKLKQHSLYPPLLPFETGYIDVGSGHSIYFEKSGKPNGAPVVFLHGGPGSCIRGEYRQLFDPNHYEVILFDQRGCGESKPVGSINNNTTWDLVDDIERIRKFCNIEKWLVFGGSWGSTLALAYAQQYPTRVSALILRGIFLMTDEELSWFWQSGASKIFPDQHEKLLDILTPTERDNVIESYHKYLTNDCKEVRLKAAKAWSTWEAETINLIPKKQEVASRTEAKFALTFALIENHYFRHRGWLEEGQLLKNMERIDHIPGQIIHGRYDIPAPVCYAYQLSQNWSNASLKIVEGAGHSLFDSAILSSIIEATDYFRKI